MLRAPIVESTVIRPFVLWPSIVGTPIGWTPIRGASVVTPIESAGRGGRPLRPGRPASRSQWVATFLLEVPAELGPIVTRPCGGLVTGWRAAPVARWCAGPVRRQVALVAAVAMVPVESALPLRLVARLLRVIEALPRVAVVAARAPVTAPTLALVALARRGPVAARAPRPFALLARRAKRLALAISRLLRLPELASREPFQLGVGVLLLEAMERGQQVVALRGAERRRQPAGDDRPVCKSRWHRRPHLDTRGMDAPASAQFERVLTRLRLGPASLVSKRV